MQAAGLRGPLVTIAHGVWPEDAELDLIGRSGTNVVLNMLSNLKRKSGVAPILDYRARGVNLALGCDNCSCSDVQSEVMKLFCLRRQRAAAHRSHRSRSVPRRDARRRPHCRALVNRRHPAARLQGRFLMDLADPAYVPLDSAVPQLVYSDSARSIRTVIVDGHVVVRDGRATRIDEAALRAEIAGLMPAVRNDGGKMRAGYAKLRPFIGEVHRRAWARPLPIDRFIGYRNSK